jgi:hypothetical protein
LRSLSVMLIDRQQEPVAETLSGLHAITYGPAALYSEQVSALRTRFRITVSAGRRSQPALGTGPLGSKDKAENDGFLKRLLTGLFLGGFTIAALIVALVIGSVIAVILWGLLAVAVAGAILAILFRRPRR